MVIELHKNLKAVIKADNGFIKKTKDISKEEFKALNLELAGDRIDMVRTANRLFKPKVIRYKGVG